MLTLLKIANITLVLSMLAFGYLGTQDRMYWNYLPIPFGALFMSNAWAIFLARQPLNSEQRLPAPAGTRHWRHILVFFFSIGAFTAYMGLRESFPAVNHQTNAYGLAVAVALSAWVFYRTRIDVVPTPLATTISYAHTNLAYGQTERAARLIENALEVTPEDPELVRTLNDIRSGRQLAPPAGNQKIALHTDHGTIVVSIPSRPKMLIWYIAAVGVAVWLVLAWLPAVIDVVNEIRTTSGGVQVFLSVWLAGWSLGGLFGIAMIGRLLRPSTPETLRLQADGVAYDSGIQPLFVPASSMSSRGLRRLFPERVVRFLDRERLSSLTLENGSDGKSLSILLDGRRIFIAIGLASAEREKLYKLLTKRYALTPST
jgi:hypothetical protein